MKNSALRFLIPSRYQLHHSRMHLRKKIEWISNIIQEWNLKYSGAKEIGQLRLKFSVDIKEFRWLQNVLGYHERRKRVSREKLKIENGQPNNRKRLESK